MAELIITGGPLTGQRFEVERRLTIGREGADLAIPDAEVSRRHAELRIIGDEVQIEDLDSLNGTWVDGRRISGCVSVGQGATVRIGATTFTVAVALPERSERTRPASGPPEPLRPEPPLVPASGAPAARGVAGAVTPRSAVPSHRRRRVASRRWLPAAVSFATIIVTAVALVIYFAAR